MLTSPAKSGCGVGVTSGTVGCTCAPFAASDEREEQCGRRKRFPEKLIKRVH